MIDSRISLINVATPDGDKDYVALISPELAFSIGFFPEAILGVLRRPLSPGDAIAWDNFIPNSVFARFLASVIATYGPEDPELRKEAKRIGKGSVVLVDRRTPTPEGPVPPEDILGVFAVDNGAVTPSGYIASPNHRLLTERGFFGLTVWLEQCLCEEMAARAASHQSAGPVSNLE
jgi:hypothetical protein